MEMCTLQIKGAPRTWPSHPRLWLPEARHNGLFPWLSQLGPLCNAAAFLPEDVWLIILSLSKTRLLPSASGHTGPVGHVSAFLHGDLITPPAHSRLAPASRMNRGGQLCSCTVGLGFHFHGFARVAQSSNGRSQQALLDLVLIMRSQEVSHANKEHAGKKTSVTFNHLVREGDDCRSRCHPGVFSRYWRNLKSFLCMDRVIANQFSAASFSWIKHLRNQQHILVPRELLFLRCWTLIAGEMDCWYSRP